MQMITIGYIYIYYSGVGVTYLRPMFYFCRNYGGLIPPKCVLLPIEYSLMTLAALKDTP